MFKTTTNSISKIFAKPYMILESNVSGVNRYSYYLEAARTYDFLDSYNYVGNRGIYWTHPESSYIIRVTDDFEQCLRGNRSNDDTCWWYFSKRALPMMQYDFNQQEIIDINKELRNWSILKSGPKKLFEWATNISRIYAAIPNVSYEQKVFAMKDFAAAFYTDDCIEQFNSHCDFDGAADELAKNLSLIWSGIFNKRTDMNQFRGQDNIPDIFIDNANRVLDMRTELGLLAKEVLKPKIFDLYNLNFRGYLRGCMNERPLFQKHIPTKTFIGEEEGMDVRLLAVGFYPALVTNMTEERFVDFFHRLDWVNNLVAFIVAAENDIGGYFKDKEKDFCPMTFYGKLNQSGKTELEAARQTIKRTNEAKRACELLWEKSPPKHQKYYEYLVRYNMHFLDFNFCTGLQNGNSRYGWKPKLD